MIGVVESQSGFGLAAPGRAAHPERKWHQSQQIKELEKGEIELTLELCYTEIVPWILSWGIHASGVAQGFGAGNGGRGERTGSGLWRLLSDWLEIIV
jgi:hypothetical protein